MTTDATDTPHTPDPAGPADAANRCLNCGHPVSDRYCGACGQEAVASVVSFRELVASAIDSYLSLDSKLVRSLVPFLRHPGLLSEEYVRGRRERYVSPIRLYLVSSLLFFVVASFLVDRSDTGFLRITNTSKNTEAPAPGALPQSADSLAVGSRGNSPTGAFFERLFETDPQEISAHFVRQLPRALFVLVPVFALLLRLIYARRSRLYIEHLVLGLHVHAFLFLVATPAMLIPTSIGAAPVLLLSSAYLLLSMKRFYAQGWIKTLLKSWLLQAMYLVVVTVAMLATLVLTVMFSLG